MRILTVPAIFYPLSRQRSVQSLEAYLKNAAPCKVNKHHPLTFRLRQACGFEHSDDRRLLLVL